ncbi:MAG TPA: DUF554 domain-containing protein [Anaerolineaceae bacterium]|nr:DUF554 domain-containing protein [Anaerolineaceae bacterium]HQN04870.1 DUF554 domain-containing protein [Anaerolineaceae bacterium]HQP08202.1 DUF554 domain-containing protein [Anaerolineaceae bacterium]
MTGTFINIATVIIGGTLGCLLGSRLPERIRQTVVTGLGLFTLAYGISMFIKTQNAIVVVLSLLIGIVLGELWNIEKGLNNLGTWLEVKVLNSTDESSQKRFIKGFLTASLLFCVGPMAILGSVQDGLTGDYQLLVVKSILDGFAALAFAASMGVGVLFSIIPVLLYQGGITLLAIQAQSFFTEAMITEMSAVGGVILLAIGIGGLLELKPIRTANFLPALVLAPLLVALLAWLGIAFS